MCRVTDDALAIFISWAWNGDREEIGDQIDRGGKQLHTRIFTIVLAITNIYTPLERPALYSIGRENGESLLQSPAY
jgi:hypothetical protein